MTPPQSLYSSFASRKRSSPTVKPLPEAVAWLEDITIEMTTANSIRSAVQYNLRVVYQPKGAAAASWDVKHTFDQYRSFQKRLLRQLQPRHSCKAECRWLYSTVKKHFPRPMLLGSHCPTVVDQRHKALLQLLTTVQASIVNHGNRGCAVLMEAVSSEFTAFLVGNNNKSTADGVTPPVTPSTSSELETPASSRPSFTSSISSEECEEDTVNYNEDQWIAWPLPAAGPLDLARTTSSPV